MINEAIAKLVEKIDLKETEAEAVMEEIMTGRCTDAQIAGFLTALRMKGETVAEITACARVMRAKAVRIEAHGEINLDREDINFDHETIVDTCGTGGSNTKTFNISTATAFVVAGAGVKVAKHGNRAVSSTCGSADVLEELGINLKITPEKIGDCLRQIGIGFLFAPLLHRAMKHVIAARKQLGIRTVFNILGPLTNPAGASAQVLGVYSRTLTDKLAEVLQKLGSRRAFVVHGADCLDEITITGKTTVAELNDQVISQYEIHPSDFGIPVATLEDLKGGDAKQNAAIVLDVLRGLKGPRRDIVIFNAAFALLAADKVKNVEEGLQLAAGAIDNGSALAKLNALREFTRQ